MQGHPFMQSITENRPFFYSILVASGAVTALVTRCLPDVADQFEVVPFPPEVRRFLLFRFRRQILSTF